MGIVSSLLAQSNNNMKFLLVLAAAASAKAEADPGFAYSVGHLPLAYSHVASPVVYSAPSPVVYTVAAPAAGCQNSEGKFVPCAQGSYFGMSLLLLLPLLQRLLLLSRLKGRREKLSPLLKPRLTPRPTLGYTIAACTVIMDTDMVDITMLR